MMDNNKFKQLSSLYFVAVVLILTISGSDAAGKGDANCVSSDELVFRSPKDSKRYVTGGACNPIFLQEASGTMILGNPGTVFTAENNSITLNPGKIVIFAGKHPTHVNANGFLVVASDSTCIVQLLPDKLLRLENLCGKKVELVISVVNKPETLTVQAHEEICIIKVDDFHSDNNDLIPVDGVDREPIMNSVMPAGYKFARSVFDVKMMVQKEELLACKQLHSKRARQKIRNLKRSVERSSHLQPPKNIQRPLMKY